MLQAVRVESAVDWITAVTLDPKRTSIMLSRAERLARDEARQGNDIKPWGMSGFEGIKVGQLQCGNRNGEGIVRLSGHLAALEWFDFYQDCDRVTRIDVQETYRLDQSPTKYIIDNYARALRFKRKNKMAHQVRLVTSDDGGATLYLGSRQSERMIRQYNKHAESKLDHYQGCIRNEAELKGMQAQIMGRRLASGSAVQDTICSHLLQFISAKGCSSPSAIDSRTPISVPRSSSDRARALAWLAKAVRPSLRVLLDDGLSCDVVRSLALSEEDCEALLACYRSQNNPSKGNGP